MSKQAKDALVTQRRKMMMNPSTAMSKKTEDQLDSRQSAAGEGLSNLKKTTLISPDVKCSEIIASINIEKVTPEIIVTVQELLMDTLPIYELSIAFGLYDAAGCNWVGFNSISTKELSNILSKLLHDIDPFIDYDLAIVYLDEITDKYTMFIPVISHLSTILLLLS